MARRSYPALLLALVLTTTITTGCSSDSEPGGATTTTVASLGSSEVAAEPSAGCGVEPDVGPIGADRPGDAEATLEVGGDRRTYRLAVPADYDPDVAVPLVINLHGSGSNAQQASVYGDLPRAGTDRRMIVATPDAGDGIWELGGSGPDADFLLALVDDLKTRFCVDQNRVHGAGMSLGAWKAAVTACDEPGRFASLGLVTVEVFPGSCEPMPVVAFHGTADRTVPYGEGGGDVDAEDTPNGELPGARDNIAAWAASADCDDDPEQSAVGDDVTVLTYRGCADGAEVVLHTIEGGGHTWPGSDIVIGGDPVFTTQTIDATEIILDFFEAHPRRG